MSDFTVLFRAMQTVLATEGGRARFCAAIIAEGEAFLVNPEALRIIALRTMPYDAYLRTEHWKSIARRAKERAGHRCQLCNSPDNLEAHHRTYERRGAELETDLTVLCSECHGRFHREPVESEPQSEPKLTTEQEAAWLQELVRSKRLEQGIDPATGIPEREFATLDRK